MIKFKSIRTAILTIIISLTFIGMTTLSVIGYYSSKTVINTQIKGQMEQQLNYVAETIVNNQSKHNQVALVLEKSVEAILQTENQETYYSMLENVLSSNENTFGVGVWFEPYIVDEKEKYFGPYAYKTGDEISLTMEYSNEDYDYFQYDWYKNAKGISDSYIYSEPYYDETSDITMITTSVPIYDENQNFIGVVTADMDLDSVQNFISETKVGKTGWAFLIDDDGTYLANNDSEKVMKESIFNESNETLASIGRDMVDTGNGDDSYIEEGSVYDIYYEKVDKTDWYLALVIPQKELYASLGTLMKNLIIAFAFSIIIVVMGVIIYTNKLSKNINKLKETAESLANGDFTVESDINTKDEIGILSTSFNVMIENIKKLLFDSKKVSLEVVGAATDLAATSQETSVASEEISRTIEEIAKGAQKQAQDAEKGVNITNSLDVKFNMLEDNSIKMKNKANDVSDTNKSGMIVVDELIGKTHSNNQSLLRIEQAIKQLDEKSKNIGMILETITSISEQTNLLALNASIEAARAGEAGRGFNVVAEEIRKLAEGSKNASFEISNIVKELQQQSNNTVDIMNEVKDNTDKQTKSVKDVNRVFENTVKSVDIIIEEIELVNENIKNIIEDKNFITVFIENISAVSEETAASSEEVTASMEQQTVAVEEVARSADKLDELSSVLNEQINRFKI
ncbi:MAG: methyl-accepting chemotaxis protein [Clostridiaceae bacterium]